MAKSKAVQPAVQDYTVEAEPPSEGTLQLIRERMRETRDREARVHDLKSVLSEETKALNAMKFEVLPELFAQAGIDNLGLPPEGNNPAYDFRLRNFTHASISAEWEPERKAEAYKVLETVGGKDLIKTEIYAFLPAGSRGLVKKAVAALKKLGIVAEVESSVQWNTLTAFIKEATEKRGLILPLEKLGAQQGMIVEWKERKDGTTQKESRSAGNAATATRSQPEGTKRKTY
jgi:hypothetical protein